MSGDPGVSTIRPATAFAWLGIRPCWECALMRREPRSFLRETWNETERENCHLRPGPALGPRIQAHEPERLLRLASGLF